MHFTIKYVRRWFDWGDKNDDTKDETIICSDGSVTARQYDHHSSNGHFRLIKRATGTVSPIEAIKLYIHLKRMVQHCHYERLICDEYDEVIITEPG